MVWERFQHICRRSLAPLRHGELLVERVREIEVDRDSALYGPPLRRGTLPHRILNRLAAHPNEDRARQLLEFYANLNLGLEMGRSLSLKRMVLYLSLIALLSLGLYGICQLLVTASSAAPVQPLPFPPLEPLLTEYGWMLLPPIILLIGLALMKGVVLRELADWLSWHDRGGLSHLLIPRSAHAAYADLEAALLFPLGPDAISGQSKVASHLWRMEEEGIDPRDDIAALVRCRHRTLIRLCEQQLCLVYSLGIVLTGVTIGLLMVIGYLPTGMLDGIL